MFGKLSNLFTKKEEEAQAEATQSAPPQIVPATPPPTANPPAETLPAEAAPAPSQEVGGILIPPQKTGSAPAPGTITQKRQKRVTQRITVSLSAPGQSPKVTLPVVRPPTAEEETSENITLPASLIINELPASVLAGEKPAILNSQGQQEVEVPAQMILGALPSGKLEFAVKDFTNILPEGTLKPEDQLGGEGEVNFALPLEEVVKRIPPALFSKRFDQKPVDEKVEQIAEPFAAEPGAEEEENTPPATEEATEAVQPPIPPPPPPAPLAEEEASSIEESQEDVEKALQEAASFTEEEKSEAAAAAEPEKATGETTPEASPESPAAPELSETPEEFKTEAPTEPEPSPEPEKGEEPAQEEEKPFVPFGPPAEKAQETAASTEETVSEEEKAATAEEAPVEATTTPEEAPAEAPPDSSEETSVPKPIQAEEGFEKLVEEPDSASLEKTSEQSEEEMEEPVATTEEAPQVEKAPAPFAQEASQAKEFFVPTQEGAAASSLESLPIPTTPVPMSAPAVTVQGKAMNLNQCTIEELSQVVEPAVAKKIWAWRELHGPFTHLEVLKNVPGLTEEAYHQLVGLPDAEEKPLGLDEIFGLPFGTQVTVKEAATRIKSLPYMAGCIIGGMEGLPIAFDCDDKKFAKEICALVPKLFQQTNSILEKMDEPEPSEIHLVQEGKSLILFRCAHLVLIAINRKKGISIRDSELIRQVVHSLAHVKESKLEV